ncbi:MAG: methyl-accepting chemotaxis protein [Beijerinckiaceae bacterium]|nr:methyl-accepting chemotaxis protein [Beijerinckiaceae bacterium]
MKLRSIQSKIAILSGLCVFGATGGLVIFGMVSSHSTKSYVAEHVADLSDRKTQESLQTLASTQAGIIRSELNAAFDSARDMAHAFEIVAGSGDKGATPAAARRAQLNGILLDVLKDNPTFNGTYSAWEPNALDQQDAEFRNNKDIGSDATGRFLPYWTRDAAGHVAIQPLVEYDSHELHSNGVMKGGWYIGPQNGGGESILDPLPYIVQGKNVFLATMSVPIMIDGKFSGVAGADFDLSFVQRLAEHVKASIYGGKASVTIISYKGLVVASSDHPDTIAQSIDRLEGGLHQYVPLVQSGREQVVADAKSDSIMAFAPIALGRTKTPWSVMINVPRPVAMAEVTALGEALDRRSQGDIILQTLVALVIAGAGVGFMWMVARGIASPILAMTGAMRRLADKDLAVEIPGVGRADEIGDMAAAVQVFKDNGIRLQASEAEAARQRQAAEQERAANEATRNEIQRQQEAMVASIAAGLERLSSGDLTNRLNQAFSAEYEKLRADFNATAESLQSTLTTISAATDGISTGSDQIAHASDDLSRRTEQQAANLEETAAALNIITGTVKSMAATAGEAAKIVASTRGAAESSGAVVQQAVDAMGKIKDSSTQITNIIGVIDEIAFQTNLLALNAGVEAARAGDAGRGFAVVASEVRALAQRSAEAAKEIKALISASTVQVESGVVLVDKTGVALKDIIAKVTEMDGLVRQISASSQEQATGIAEINTAVAQMDQVVQQNAAMVEESTAAAHTLKSETQDLTTMVGKFRLGGQSESRVAAPIRKTGAPAPRPLAKKAASAGASRAVPEKDWDEF